MDRDLSTRKRKKSIEETIRNVKKSVRNGSGIRCGLCDIYVKVKCYKCNFSRILLLPRSELT